MNCQHCQSLLLDHLYGLLDGSEAAALDAHLASCPACASARAETARMQGLIARAAKSAFPQTKFEAPAEAEPTYIATPAGDVPAARPSRRVASFFPWAVAAAVLAAIPGTVLPVLGIFDRAENTRREAEVAKLEAATATRGVENAKAQITKSLTDAEFTLATAKQNRDSLVKLWVTEQKTVVEAATTRRFSVDVLKPATVQPGAPNEFVVVVNDRRQPWETTGKRMVAEVHAVEASDAVIFSQTIDTERTAERKHLLRLPAKAWAQVKPNAELYLVVAQVDEKTQTRTELQERVKLAGPVFTTLLVTDKATYRPGERLFFRSLTLDRVTLQPPTRDQILKYELLSSKGKSLGTVASITGTTDLVRVTPEGIVDPVRGTDGQPVRGVGCGEFVLPSDLPNGDYILRLTEGQHPGGFPATVPVPVTRTVKVRAGTVETHRKEIGFTRASYVPGDTVEAWAEVKFQNQPLAGAPVVAVAVEADGVAIAPTEASKKTDAAGRARVRFNLPNEVLNGDVRLRVTFRTPHGEEAVAKRVPVIGNRIVIEFFPECGDAVVAGVPCKVYVRATTPAGQPVDIRGIVTDGRNTLAKVESLSDRDQPGANRGLASFTYTPELGIPIWLKLEAPSTVYAPILAGVPVHHAAVALVGGPGASALRTGFMLPEAKPDGVVMSVLDPITAPGEPIRVKLYSVGQPRNLVVGAYTRGKLSDTQSITVEPGLPQIVKLMAGTDPRGGVVRITAFEEIEEKPGQPKPDLKPVAERLVFRKPGEVLKLAFTTTNGSANIPAAPKAAMLPPGTPVQLSIAATDEKGNPAAAILWAAVVNTGVAPGTKDRLPPTHFLLAGEVKDADSLEHADFLLTDHPKAAETLDLLLGTQGWRRFAEQTPAAPGMPQRFMAVADPDLTKLKLQNGQYATWTDPVPVREHRQLYQKYAPRYEAAVKAVERATEQLEATRQQASDPRAVAQATAAAEAARAEAAAKTAQADAAREPVRRFRANVWIGVVGFAALAIACGLASFLRPTGRLPLGFSTLGSVGLVAFLLVAASWGEEAQAGEKAALAPQVRLNEAEALRDAPAQPPARGGANAELAMPPAGPPAKNDFGMGVADKANVVNGAVAGGTPPTRPQVAKDEAPLFHHYPPPVVLPDAGRTGERKGSTPFNFGGQPQPSALPLPLPPPALVAKPGGVAPPAAPGVSGPQPVPAAGITTDINPTMPPAPPAGGLGGTPPVDSLKKVTEHVEKHTRDRRAEVTAPLDAYMAGRAKSKSEVLGAVPKETEVFAIQQVREMVQPMQPLVVREFAAPRPTAGPMPDAGDTPDTVLWQPVIVLPADGKTTLNFYLGSAPGGYEVVIAGHTTNGRLGATRGLIRVSPQTIAPSMPPVPAGAVPPAVPVAPGPRPMP